MSGLAGDRPPSLTATTSAVPARDSGIALCPAAPASTGCVTVTFFLATFFVATFLPAAFFRAAAFLATFFLAVAFFDVFFLAAG
ncbi:MAG: hypothetical protein AAF458_23125 [Pseudomonadota bacterium]